MTSEGPSLPGHPTHKEILTTFVRGCLGFRARAPEFEGLGFRGLSPGWQLWSQGLRVKANQVAGSDQVEGYALRSYCAILRSPTGVLITILFLILLLFITIIILIISIITIILILILIPIIILILFLVIIIVVGINMKESSPSVIIIITPYVYYMYNAQVYICTSACNFCFLHCGGPCEFTSPRYTYSLHCSSFFLV